MRPDGGEALARLILLFLGVGEPDSSFFKPQVLHSLQLLHFDVRLALATMSLGGDWTRCICKALFIILLLARGRCPCVLASSFFQRGATINLRSLALASSVLSRSSMEMEKWACHDAHFIACI